MIGFAEYTREQYDTLLALGDVFAVRESLANRFDDAVAGAHRERLEFFVKRVDRMLGEFAGSCHQQGLHREFALITHGFHVRIALPGSIGGTSELPTLTEGSDGVGSTLVGATS
jgi:hypothetical protein